MSGALWWDRTLPLWVGCSRASAGCDHCYAVREVHRLEHHPTVGADFAGLLAGGEWTGRVKWRPELLQRLRRRQPGDWFCSSLGDWGHPAVPDDQRRAFYQAARQAQQHRLFCLTKRPATVAAFLRPLPPLTNLWAGFTAETQEQFDRRWAALRPLVALGWSVFVSVEPLLGRVVLPPDFLALGRRTWVIIGGETGPLELARPPHPEWVRELIHQCLGARVPVLFKKWGAFVPVPEFGFRPAGDAGTVRKVDLPGGKGGRQRRAWIAYPRDDAGDAGRVWRLWPAHRRYQGASVSVRMVDGAIYDARPPRPAETRETIDVAA